MAGTTDVGIANLALVDIGEPTIASFEAEGKAARIMRAVYEPTVLEVLRGHPWRCCRKQVVLAADPDAVPTFGWDAAFPLPSDFVKVIKVNDHIDKFERVGRHLFVNDTAPQLTYTARVPSVYFDPLLVSVVAARLAARVCMTMTDNATAAKGYNEAYAAISGEAKLADAMDGAPEDMPIGTWAQARLSEA